MAQKAGYRVINYFLSDIFKSAKVSVDVCITDNEENIYSLPTLPRSLTTLPNVSRPADRLWYNSIIKKPLIAVLIIGVNFINILHASFYTKVFFEAFL